MTNDSFKPDIVGISFVKKKIAIGPEITIPSDSRPTALLEAHNRKLQSYGPLLVALQQYIDSGWAVSILPWVVGARGMIKHALLTPSLEFLDIPKQRWSTIIEHTVCASVAALAYMNRVRFSLTCQNSMFDTDDPRVKVASQETRLSVGNKRKDRKDGEDPLATQKRWKRIIDVKRS